MRLEGKVALITGGGTGIGAAIAERFVAEGAKVCIAGRRQEVLDKVAQALPADSVTTCSGDVSRDEDAARMVARTISFGGRIDVLVNNAGVSAQGAVAEMDSAHWRHVMEVNLTGPFLCMKEALPRMIEGGGGSIINISSIGGLRGLPNRPAYCTSKAGLIMLTQQTAIDYGAYKIRCNVICPGGVRTDMTDADFGAVGKRIGMETDDFVSLLSSEIPLVRFAEPREIGGMCAYLASDDASFVTASVLVIDGGTSAQSVVGAAIKRAVMKSGKE